MNKRASAKSKSRLRRLAVFGLLALALLVAFHRPIVFGALRFFVERIAREQNLEVHYEIRGNLVSTLMLTQLDIRASGPAPIERLRVGQLQLRYDLWDLATKGMAGFVEEFAVRNVSLDLPAPEPSEPGPPSGGIPWIIPGRVSLEDINIRQRRADGEEVVLEHLFLTLRSNESGILRIRTLSVPGLARLSDVSATTSYANRTLHLSDLILMPGCVFDHVAANFSEIESGRFGLDLAGTVFDAPVSLSATVDHLPASPRVSGEGKVSALELDRLAGLLPDLPPLQGRVSLDGHMATEAGQANGTLQVTGEKIRIRDVPIQGLEGRVTLENSLCRVDALDVVLSENNRIHSQGTVDLAARAYDGKITADLGDLAVFQPLVAGAAIGGALHLDWSGSGSWAAPRHAGTLWLSLEDGRWGDRRDLRAGMSGSYSEAWANLPYIALAAGDEARAEASAFWSENRLQISFLSLTQNKTLVLSGNGELPLRLSKNPAEMIPRTEPLAFSAWSKNLDLGKLSRWGSADPLVSGQMNLALEASGSMENLSATLEAKASGLQSPSSKELAPATAAVSVGLKDHQLRLEGTITQRLMQPLRLTGVLPLNLPQLLESGRPDPASPLDLRLQLPESSLAFVTTFVPALRTLRGTVQGDIRVGGSLQGPTFGGSVRSRIQTLRFRDASLPPIDATNIRMDFANDRLRISDFSGVVAGGRFLVGGSVDLRALSKPVLDLTFGARNALVLQNDDLSVRVSSDLRVRGLWAAAAVSGTVGITRSRFYRDIDILPIGLPGRPAPQLPEQDFSVSFPKPPLRDWTFDVAVKTLDPFLIQSNLARGRVVVDLKLGGTGLRPWLDGAVEIEQLTAALPFSRLNISAGRMFFSAREPFVPQLSLEATSQIRDRQVSVFINGPLTNPTAVFSSQPPLPQTEIVSLLATGMTTSQLGRDPNALAGQAALLAVRQLYRRVFRSNKPPSENESFFERIQFDLGVVDPKTGRQATTIGVPLSDRILLTGGMDVGGNFQGQVKYLIRFR